MPLDRGVQNFKHVVEVKVTVIVNSKKIVSAVGFPLDQEVIENIYIVLPFHLPSNFFKNSLR
jgi:hypothetical protein